MDGSGDRERDVFKMQRVLWCGVVRCTTEGVLPSSVNRIKKFKLKEPIEN